ncbi:MAG: SDR family oxidoreductase [Clostridiaceae bacterium]|nr:SDR family oxidoreductase [Clostridiaceae bacterium]
MSVQSLVEMSNRYGKNPDYVLAGGGNTSFKDAQYLWVKASGQTLATIDAEGFVKLSRARLTAIFDRSYDANPDTREAQVLADMLGARCPGEEAKRPSVEALLHNLIPSAYVLHLHPTAVGGFVCGRDAASAFDALFAADSVWIPQEMPGYILATTVLKAQEAFNAAHGTYPSYIFLENHGVFLGGETVSDVDAAWDILSRRLGDYAHAKGMSFPVWDDTQEAYDISLAASVAPAIRGLAFPGDRCGVVVFDAAPIVRTAVADADAFAKVYTTFTPDHLVYCGSEKLFVPAESIDDSLRAAAGTGKPLPRIIGVQGLGVFATGANPREAYNASRLFRSAAGVAAAAEVFGGGKPLSEDLIDAISNWEVERYRKGVSSGKSAGGRLAGKVALITGAAQGFGRGIAEELAAEGAFIAAADLNFEGAQELAQSLCAQYGKGHALAVAANVGDEDQVREMTERTAVYFGGIDIFVSNAGIVRAGDMESMTLANFELSTKINYTAFFLGAKYASRVMKREHAFDPEAMFDILQINSKSGLEGSNKNFAYAGSKFGGIGLVESFALELCGDNIKVNAICPGNFLDGPLWCDPVKGLFVQYLNSGKVPGAKTVADVKRHYESKVPMNRGCRVRDVAVAILYLVEQKYETGQALPVTGGQVMLK